VSMKILLAALGLFSAECFGGEAFVTRAGMQFRYQGSPIAFCGGTFYPAVVGGSGAWQKPTFPAYIDQIIAMAQDGGQNILRPTDYWSKHNSNQSMTDPRIWANMDYLLAACTKKGMFVLMDLSAYRWLLVSQGVDPFVAAKWNVLLDWVAARYRNEPAIAFWSIVGEPGPPKTKEEADRLVAFYGAVTARLHANDPNHLICAGGFNHMGDSPKLRWWQRIYALPSNDVCAYKTYSRHDLDLTPAITAYGRQINKVLINQEFGLPQSQGDAVWSGAVYNGIKTSRAEFFKNVYDLGLAGNVAGFQFWNLGPEVKDKSYQVSPTNSPAVWKVLRQYAPARHSP